MIRIQFDGKNDAIDRVSIRGHANSGPYGQDLVCCGVSAIVLSSLNAIDTLFPQSCLLEAKDNQIKIEVQKNCAELQVCLHMLQAQLQAMALEYPKFIQMRLAK